MFHNPSLQIFDSPRRLGGDLCKLDSIKFISPLEAAPVEEKGAEVEEKQNLIDLKQNTVQVQCGIRSLLLVPY